MLGLLAQGFRLELGAQFFLKSGQARASCWCEAIFMTKVQVITQPLVIVRPLSGHDVPVCQPRLVAMDEFRRDGEHGDVSGAMALALKDRLLIKVSKINWFLSKRIDYGR